jgi:transposase InsO family protein
VAASDIAKTAIITPFGLFEFTRMPFGLRNAGMTFQRLMDSILGGLPFAFVYLDDILKASSDEAAHWRHLEAVFSALQQNGLVINPDKCLLACKSVDFLGHHLSASGIGPLPARVQAIADFPRPATVKQLQAFLGLFNFYRRFIPAAAKLVLPLTRSLRGGPKGATLLVWSPAMAAAFQAARGALSFSAVLAHPVAGAELSLVTDASATHVGAVVQQRCRGQAWRPLGFFSAQLNKAEVNYSAFDRELLAVVAAIRHFRYLLEGRSFVVFTDHKPLVGALHRRSDPISARQQRHLSFTAEFAPSIWHLTGESNIVTDTFSRPSGECSALPLSGSAATNVAATCSGPGAADQGSTEVKVPPGSSVPPATDLRVSEISLHGSPILVDTSSGVFRPIIPEVSRRPHLRRRAQPGTPWHQGDEEASRFVWPGLASQVAAWCRDCQSCQRGKVTSQPSSPPGHIANPTQRFSDLHIDLVGPLPTSRDGFTHLFTVIDRSTRWAEAIPLRSTSAASCADALVTGWVARFGVPEQVTSDQGWQFCSSIWDALSRQLGTKMRFTTAYHPPSNGLVERFHRRLKEALRARLASADWPQHLPWVLLGLRAAPREDSGISVAELVYSCPLSLPGQFLSAAELPPDSFVSQLRSSLPCVSDHTGCSPPATPPPLALRTASFVYVRSPPLSPGLAPAYRGPYRVRDPGDKYFVVDVGGSPTGVSVDRL